MPKTRRPRNGSKPRHTSSIAPAPSRVFLPFGWFANVDEARLEAVLRRLTGTVERAPDGLVISEATHTSTFRVTRLCDAGDMPSLDARWDSAFGARPRMPMSSKNIDAFRVAAERHINEGDFGWFAWRSMNLAVSEDEIIAAALPVHRDVLFPAFFKRYPGGRVLAVTYEHRTAIEGYLSVVNILTRARRVGFDPQKLLASSGDESMAWVGLHHPVYFLWYSLYLAFAVFFPRLHGFVATLQHQAFLVYLLPNAELGKDEEPNWFERTMPGLTMAKVEGVSTPSGDIRFRKNPLSGEERYPVDDLEAYIAAVTANAERMIQKFCDLTRYPDTNELALDVRGDTVPLVDLGFARNTLLTLFVLLRRTVTNTFKSDTFERVMTLYDIVDLHAALVSTNQNEATEAFGRFVHREFALGSLATMLKVYPGRPGLDVLRGLRKLRAASIAAVTKGILNKRSDSRVVVTNRRKKGAATVSALTPGDFEARLLRALRNTKHGYETNDADLLAMHTGAVDEDFPDYALVLMLGLLADSSEYKLGR